eukprot:scaffold2117_cov241-Pinguiococcus_pyrenoidosus.AAC.14
MRSCPRVTRPAGAKADAPTRAAARMQKRNIFPEATEETLLAVDLQRWRQKPSSRSDATQAARAGSSLGGFEFCKKVLIKTLISVWEIENKNILKLDAMRPVGQASQTRPTAGFA